MLESINRLLTGYEMAYNHEEWKTGKAAVRGENKKEKEIKKVNPENRKVACSFMFYEPLPVFFRMKFCSKMEKIILYSPCPIYF